MKQTLEFDFAAGIKDSFEACGRSIRFYAWKGIPYCENPLDPIQTLNLFMPASYAEGVTINGYTKETAPIFLPNAVGGYMPGPADEPGLTRHGEPNAIFCALEHGYVVASGGVRGRTSGRKSDEFFEGSKETVSGETGNTDGKMVGRAPALIVDYKAIIRYLRYNHSRRL